MKVTFYKIFLLGALLLGPMCMVYAQETVTKQIKESHPLTNTGELHLENKYGNITINGWIKNEIQVTVDIKVIKKKKEDAEELLQRITPVFNYADDFINISSIIKERTDNFISRFFSKTNLFDFDKSNIQIDYTIFLPANAEIDLTNKFGDVVISSWSGKLKSNVQHGNIWINKNLDNAAIDMRFGKLKTRAITYGNITSKNGEIDISTSKNLRINSSGTIIKIENVEKLEIHSSKDQITLENVTDIDGELMFGKLNLYNVQNNINLTMEVADVWISNIHNPNPNIMINQESSELNIDVSGLNINFHAALEEGLLRIPKSFTNIKTTVIDKRKRIRDISAFYGNTKETTGTFNITGKKGIIILKE